MSKLDGTVAKKNYIGATLVLSALAGCSFTNVQNTFTDPLDVNSKYRVLSASTYPGLILVQRSNNEGKVVDRLVIFVEGDGAAWLDRGRRPPDDPTPTRSVSMALFQRHIDSSQRQTSEIAIYLSRPCQYKQAETCIKEMWTTDRFGTTVMTKINRAIKTIKEEIPARKIALVGHSGGGVVATQIIKNLDNVDCVVTLASPLDVYHWTTRHGLQPLVGFENAANPLIDTNSTTKIFNYIGSNDRQVRPEDLGAYGKISAITVPNVSHNEGWTLKWPSIVENTCLKR